MKEGWEKLIVNKRIKQDWLADQCDVDKSQISRWKNPDELDFPPYPKLVLFIEAMQKWTDVQRHEPLEALNRYFGCKASDINSVVGPIEKLAGLLSTNTGKALAIILEVTSPASDGGREVTKDEEAILGPVVHLLRHVICDMDDRINGGVK